MPICKIFKHLFVCCIFIIPCIGASAFEVDADVTQTVTTDPALSWQFQEIDLTIAHAGDLFDFIVEANAINDGRYTSRFGNEFIGGYYTLMKNAGVTITPGPFSFSAGRLVHSDYVESPYSLFISSNPNPTVLLDATYDDGRFFYTTRWLQLNYMSTHYLEDSSSVSLDRGASFKTYGVHVGDFRFGMQDSAIYTGRSFDAEYLVNPLPSLLVQYVNTQIGNPWVRSGDDNAIMGLFADYTRADLGAGTARDLYAYAQLLVDDFNFNRFVHPENYQNPDKVAWSIGGRVKTDFGVFGLYHAGATKYTFEPTGSDVVNTLYGYTYYPDSSYIDLDGVERPINLAENYIGYINGENNLALRAVYSTQVFGFSLSSYIEFTLSGSKSPANPWHELVLWTDGGQGTKFLDDPVLEKKLVGSLAVTRGLGDWRFSMDLKLGYVWNALELAESSDASSAVNSIRIFKPSDTDILLAQVAFGVRYALTIK